jgi:hypothetical protein
LGGGAIVNYLDLIDLAHIKLANLAESRQKTFSDEEYLPDEKVSALANLDYAILDFETFIRLAEELAADIGPGLEVVDTSFESLPVPFDGDDLEHF